MITIRTAVFETNSSSEHCIVYHKEARDPSEFPPLNADGILEIEVKHLWQCGEAGTETGDVRDIIEYLCVLAINCFPWRDEEKAIGNSLSKTDCLLDIQYAYEKAGLEAPKGFYAYFLDVDGNRHDFEGINNKNWINGADESGTVEYWIDRSYNEMDKDGFEKYYAAHPELFANAIRAKHCIGINHNLCWDSYAKSTDHFDAGYGGDADPDENYTPGDLLTTKSELSFYRT
jgi:hypothetical protein